MPLTLEKKVDLLWDKLAIGELMHAFGRALDTHDWALYRRCLADTLRVDFSQLTGFAPVEVPAPAWTRFAKAALTPLQVHHQYTNAAIRVRGDEATGVIYMVARHRAPDGGDWNTQYGWYDNGFQRDDGEFGWRIRSLTHRYQWLAGRPDLIDLADPECAAAMRAVFGPA
ncbi:MAG: nuclear transport factor 2 family protein [Pseudomonadota bacterium]